MHHRLFLISIFICILILFVYRKCEAIDDQLFRCDECDSNCTSENAFWCFLICSLPVILCIQYLIDESNDEDYRQVRYIYNTPIIINK